MAEERQSSFLMVSYFGYPTFEEYKAAHLKTAHTPGLRKEFDVTEEEHIAQLQRVMKMRPWESVIEFVEGQWKKNPLDYKGCSLGGYFHHPETRKHIPADFLEKHDSFCGPMKPIYR